MTANRIFSAFYSGHSRDERLKVQNETGVRRREKKGCGEEK